MSRWLGTLLITVCALVGTACASPHTPSPWRLASNANVLGNAANTCALWEQDPAALQTWLATTPDRLAVWPASEQANAYAVEGCESKHGEDPNTYNLDWPDGGLMQINRATWEDFFGAAYGWTWEQMVLDDVINHTAATVIWLRNGWSAWSCDYVLGG